MDVTPRFEIKLVWTAATWVFVNTGEVLMSLMVPEVDQAK
jgi:hypothetical protein